MPLPMRENTDAEIEAFDHVCTTLGGFDPRVATEWADGYLAALLAGPRSVMPNEWMPKLAGDAFDRAFGDPTSAAQALQAFHARWQSLASQLDPEALAADPDHLRLAPLMDEWDDEARARLVADGDVTADESAAYQTGALWAQGFMEAIEDFADDWPDPVPGDAEADWYHARLADIAALTWLPDSDEMREHLELRDVDGTDLTDASPPPTRDELVDEACWAVQDLRLYWLDHAPRPETRRVAPTPGRNDPCPCGSGRKWKKCHGAPGAAALPDGG